MTSPFWKTKTLAEMSQAEWESLCDGCGQCCLIKFEDEDTGELFITNVACYLCDIEACRCRDYERRHEKVETCLLLEPDRDKLHDWAPETCAYRLLAEGKELQSWHPLVSNDPESVHRAGISIRAYAQSEEYIHPDQLPEHVIEKL